MSASIQKVSVRPRPSFRQVYRDAMAKSAAQRLIKAAVGEGVEGLGAVPAEKLQEVINMGPQSPGGRALGEGLSGAGSNLLWGGLLGGGGYLLGRLLKKKNEDSNLPLILGLAGGLGPLLYGGIRGGLQGYGDANMINSAIPLFQQELARRNAATQVGSPGVAAGPAPGSVPMPAEGTPAAAQYAQQQQQRAGTPPSPESGAELPKFNTEPGEAEGGGEAAIASDKPKAKPKPPADQADKKPSADESADAASKKLDEETKNKS